VARKTRNSALLVLMIGTSCFFFIFLFNMNKLGSSVSQIRYPEVINFGVREIGDVAVEKFFVENKGREKLIVNKIKTNCSCTGFEIKKNGEFVKANEFEIAPGKSEEVAVRLTVQGVPPNSKATSEIFFQTNDPCQKDCKIKLIIDRIKSGLSPVPDVIIIKDFKPRVEQKYLIDLFDDTEGFKQIAGLGVSDKNRIEVELFLDHFENDVKIDEHVNKKVGFIEVKVRSKGAGDFNEVIVIKKNDNTIMANKIRIIGSVLPSVDISPSKIVLPRKSSTGLIYKARCVFRSTSGQAMKLNIKKLPNGVTIKGLEKPGSIVPLEIELNPILFKNNEKKEAFIEIQSLIDGNMSDLSVGVSLDDI